jgi:hypothetical protein
MIATPAVREGCISSFLAGSGKQSGSVRRGRRSYLYYSGRENRFSLPRALAVIGTFNKPVWNLMS